MGKWEIESTPVPGDYSIISCRYVLTFWESLSASIPAHHLDDGPYICVVFAGGRRPETLAPDGGGRLIVTGRLITHHHYHYHCQAQVQVQVR